jgi:O-antigen ligase
MAQSAALATYEAALVFVGGLAVAAFADRTYAAYAAAYIAGAEVLWRMSHATLPWEFGKFGVAAVLGVAVVRGQRWRDGATPLLYFGLLVPSAFITIAQMSPTDAREQLSFNLAGPFALAVSAWFCQTLELTPAQRLRLYACMIAPAIGVAAVATHGITSASIIEFNTESNRATSGGFLPNQVSAVLALGAMMAGLLALSASTGWLLRALMTAVLVGLATQSALTFSRGGLYMTGAGLALAVLVQFRDPRTWVKAVVLGAGVFVLGTAVIWPRLEKFTGGAITERFEETDSSGRDDIARADLEIWAAHPVLGVGPGGAVELRDAIIRRGVAAHVEFTRLLAEHGVFGLAAALVLLWMALRALRDAAPGADRGAAAAMVAWGLMFMLISATRLAAPSFVLGLAFARSRRGTEPVRTRAHAPAWAEDYRVA